ncbi:VENN motif pre-toxin domain-containing protein [Stenotrophomonas rhizophila]
MQHSTSSGGISGGYGGRAENWKPTTEGATPNFGGGVPMNEKGGDSSTTYATLTEGNIVIGGQKVTAAELGVNTDAATAHRAIEAMPNAELQLANQQAMANAMGTVMATSKQIAGDIGNQAMRDLENSYLSTLSDEEKDRFKSQSAEGKSNELAARFPYSYSDAVAQQQNWGIGGDNSRALEAVTTLLVGAASGQGGGQMVANALAPYAANLIGDKFDTNHGSDPNAALQLLSHALLGALLAEANGGNAANGAGAATGGELAAKLLTEALYPGYTGELNDQQKQTILALSQAVGAVAGGLGGDGLAGAGLGNFIALNATENNFLSKSDVKQLSE